MKYLYTFCFFIKRKTIKTKQKTKNKKQKTKQNKTKQNKTKQNKTKQNENKNHSIICLQIQFVIDIMYYEKMSTKFTTCYKDFV